MNFGTRLGTSTICLRLDDGARSVCHELKIQLTALDP